IPGHRLAGEGCYFKVFNIGVGTFSIRHIQTDSRIGSVKRTGGKSRIIYIHLYIEAVNAFITGAYKKITLCGLISQLPYGMLECNPVAVQFNFYVITRFVALAAGQERGKNNKQQRYTCRVPLHKYSFSK